MSNKVGFLVGMSLIFILSAVSAGPLKNLWNWRQMAAQKYLRGTPVLKSEAARPRRFATRGRQKPVWSRSPANRQRVTAPGLDGEFMVDTTLSSGPASNQQENPSIAFDGTNYLVVWGATGTRVTTDGAVLDTYGIAIDDTMLGGLDPVVAFDGTNYLVVDWGMTIRGIRVSPAGQVLDSTAISISSGPPGTAWHQALAFDDTNYLVVWEDSRNPDTTHIYGARVTPSGTVLDSGGIPICVGASYQMSPAVTFDGANFLVVWTDVRDTGPSWHIYGARVSRAGQVLDTAGFAVDQHSGYDDVATATSDGTASLVAWQNFALGVCAARVAADGSVLDSAIVLGPPSVAYQSPAAIFDGTDYFVVWTAETPVTAICAGRVSRSGVPLDTPGVCVSAVQAWLENPAAAFDGTKYFVTWDDDRTGNPDIYGARLTRQMALLDTQGILISFGANTEHWSSAAFDGTNYLVTWTDDRTGPGAIFGARVTPSGVDLDPAGIPICTLQFHRDYSSVAFDGTNYLVTWSDGRRGDSADVYAARVSQAGIVLDPQGIPIAVGGGQHVLSRVAFNGTNYLLVWADVSDTGVSEAIRGARVSPAGRVLDSAGITVCNAPGGAFWPAVASNGVNWLVAWDDGRSGSAVDVYAARVDSAGQVLDSLGFAIAAGDIDQGFPVLASDGTDYLAAWERQTDPMNVDVRGARVSSAGAVLDSFLVLPAVASSPYQSSAAFDGANYIVVWNDDGHSPVWAIYGATVSPSGAVIDPFQVASPVNMLMWPAVPGLAAGPAPVRTGCQMLCTYTSWTGDYQGRTYDADRVWGKLGVYSGVQERAWLATPGLGLSVAPDPCTGRTLVSYSVPRACILKLELYDVSGRKVAGLVQGNAQPGRSSLKLQVSDLSRGVYLLRLDAGNERLIRKLVVD